MSDGMLLHKGRMALALLSVLGTGGTKADIINATNNSSKRLRRRYPANPRRYKCQKRKTRQG